MRRPGSHDAAVEFARAWLDPLRRERAPAEVEAGTPVLARVASHRATARCLAPVASAMRGAGALDAMAPADRALADATLEWSRGRADVVTAVLRALGEGCARARARAYLCKGAALHGLLYADPAARPSADVDLFVPARDLDRFLDAAAAVGLEPTVESAARVAAFRRTDGRDPTLVDLVLERRGLAICVEVKCDPIGVGHAVRRLDDLADGGTPSPMYPGLLVPSAEAMVLQQAFSLARRPEPDLLAHAELAGVLHVRRAEIDAARLARLVEGEGLDGILRAVLRDAHALFPGTVPAALRRPTGAGGWTPARLRRGTFATPRRETRWTQWSLWFAHALNGTRPWEGARWMLARLVPPTPLLALHGAQAVDGSPLALLRRTALRLRGRD